MDELKFRKNAFSDPNCKDKDFFDEKNASKENLQLVDELLDFDKQLATAMNVKTPTGLAERIKLNQTLGQYNTERNWNKKMLAMVASVLIIFSMVFTFLSPTSSLTVLQNDVLAHVINEPTKLLADQNKSVSDANKIIKNFGGKLTLADARFNYVGSCAVGGDDGVHLVMAGSKGAVTVFLIPNATQVNASHFSNDRFDAQLFPIDKGMMAVVGNKGEALDKFKKQLAPSINWVL